MSALGGLPIANKPPEAVEILRERVENHGTRLTRIEDATTATGKSIVAVEKDIEWIKKRVEERRENWKFWLTAISGWVLVAIDIGGRAAHWW